MSDEPTRQSVLDLLFQHTSLSAREIGSYLGITSATVRYHLRALIQDGQVEAIYRKGSHPSAAGRPGRLFRLSTRSRPDNLAALLKVVLGAGLAGLSEAERERFFAHLADQLGQLGTNGYTQQFRPSQPTAPGSPFVPDSSVPHGLPARLAAALAFLNTMNYTAAWEARRQGPQIIFHNCPYASVWRSFPGLCAMDTFLVEKLIAAPVTRLRNIDPDKPETRSCLFQARHEN